MSTAEWPLRRDRWLTAGALAVVAVLAWAYTLAGAGLGMSAMDMTRAGMAPTFVPAAEMGNITWTLPHAAIMLAMWWVMMVAMMLPGAAPVELLVWWRQPGTWGALVMGARHGGYCLGCCWFLMALLFVGGAMNLYWIVGLSLYVLLEKFGPRAGWVEWTTGAALVLTGTVIFLR